MTVGAILAALFPILVQVLQEIIKSGLLGQFLQSILKPETPVQRANRTLDEAIATGDLLELGTTNQRILDSQGDKLLTVSELSSMTALLGDSK